MPVFAQHLNKLDDQLAATLPKTDSKVRKDRIALEQHDVKKAGMIKLPPIITPSPIPIPIPIPISSSCYLLWNEIIWFMFSLYLIHFSLLPL